MPLVRPLARLLALAACAWALAGCTAPAPTPAAPVPTARLSPTPTPALLPATPTASPIPKPTPTPAYPVFAPVDELSAADLLTRPGAFHGLIAFTSARSIPWLGDPALDPMPAGWQVTRTGEGIYPYLWVFSVDGTRAGMISPQHFPAAIHVPEGGGRPLVVQNGFTWQNEAAFDAVPLPDECTPPAGGSPFAACSFSFSADGRYLAFRHGEEICGRSLVLLDRQTGERLIDDPDGRNHSVVFLPNHQVLLSSGHCEGGGVALFDPVTRQGRPLGGEGLHTDRPDGGALVATVYDYAGPGSSIWVYNLTNEQLFKPGGRTANRVRWAPDGRHFLYQTRDYEYLENGMIAVTGANRVVLFDSETGQERALAADPAFDFHLCRDANGDCDEWRGDWIRVNRRAFDPGEVSVDEWLSQPCLEMGYGCAGPAESFALNWRTGELIAWDEGLLPTALPPTPYPTPGPDTSRPAVYTDPEGAYAFYTGAKGAELWLVPQGGTPVRWVWAGQDFFYTP